MQRNFVLFGMIIGLAACGNGAGTYDATGVFETDEVIVSAEVGGKILKFNADEGDTLRQGDTIAAIDATGLILQKEQVEASIESLHQKTLDVNPQLQLLRNQLAVQQVQLNHLQREKLRFEKLVKADAATQKQVDDLTAQYDVLLKQMDVTRQQIQVQQTLTETQNRSVLSEQTPLEKRKQQLQDQWTRSFVVNPVGGVMLTKYANAGEITMPGKALYKVGTLQQMKLRAYVSGSQLSQLKLGQKVKVLIDNGAEHYKTYEGTINWISDKAEFTPKTIQTKEERANLVYAIKILVSNDGSIKIGMYGEVQFK